ncbi:MAG: NAD-dependent epimerase/dehydratase family protein [Faecalicoccus sp.]|nr:NAD-dependent epimerase/dehydratase family protein [Faecalicoccus sp.]
MKKILITGGTVFVSKYTADYMVKRGYDVYVLNRGNHEQIEGVTLLQGDRHNAASLLKDHHFDVVLDITAYSEKDIRDFARALGSYDQYIMVSSSAVYPETGKQPFVEEEILGPNKFWKDYGTDKIAAERALLEMVPDAYIVRPPYLYGPMNNVYREAFVFECALANRPFYLPKDGSMKLQFFMVDDLCRLFEILMDTKPKEHILNVGNKESIRIKDWVNLCYACADKKPFFIEVHQEIDQRKYFPFYEYEYYLDVTKQNQILTDTMSMEKGLGLCYEWYLNHKNEVKRKPLLEFIEQNPDIFKKNSRTFIKFK